MKISPITRYCYKNKLNNSKLPVKNKEINFGIFMGYAPSDIQLYRCIGEAEYKKLINNETISSSGFATTDPKGWASTDWTNGFMPINKGYQNYYFITFKKNRFSQIADFRDSVKDTKYKILDSYSIKDIENIRKGNNAHGELVWAENFEEEKKKDVSDKKATILWLVSLLKSNNPKIDRKAVITELISYSREFPEINNFI